MFLVAEAGVNHGGRFSTALALADAAKRSGADAVKYQFFDSQKLWGDDRIWHLELRFADFERIYQHCQDIGIEFMCTAFGVAELTMLKPLLKRVKVPSGMWHRKEYMDAVWETGLPTLLSTGMGGVEEIRKILDFYGADWDVTVLQCTSSYPCRLKDVHLRAMTTWEQFGYPIGLSDHTTSITVPIAAAALGASVIEKHFTLDRKQEGPDHKASITPGEFKAMRLAIIEVETAMGDGEKKVLPCEEGLRAAWRGN